MPAAGGDVGRLRCSISCSDTHSSCMHFLMTTCDRNTAARRRQRLRGSSLVTAVKLSLSGSVLSRDCRPNPKRNVPQPFGIDHPGLQQAKRPTDLHASCGVLTVTGSSCGPARHYLAPRLSAEHAEFRRAAPRHSAGGACPSPRRTAGTPARTTTEEVAACPAYLGEQHYLAGRRADRLLRALCVR